MLRVTSIPFVQQPSFQFLYDRAISVEVNSECIWVVNIRKISQAVLSQQPRRCYLVDLAAGLITCKHKRWEPSLSVVTECSDGNRESYDN